MSYTVGHYLLDRLVELGVTDIFGVPGDFNLHFLDHVLEHEKLSWVGNANELNAGYAADGYARVRGLGVLCTTYGVGELSAINATAGSYAENVPVIHIVGAPGTTAQQQHGRMHHTLGDGDFNHFVRMAREVNYSVAVLDRATATSDIDRVLREAIVHRKPGYLMVPVDVARVPASAPSTPLDVNLRLSDPEVEDQFRHAVRDFIRGKKTAVLADIMTERLGAVSELNALVTSTGFPFASILWGKAMIDETLPNYAGIYIGALSDENTRRVVEEAEVLICSGVEFTDMTSAHFSQQIDSSRVIDLGAQGATVAGAVFAPLTIADALNIIREVATEVGALPADFSSILASDSSVEVNSEPLTQHQLWSLLPQHLDTKNTVVVDMGTSFFGMAHQKFPEDSRFIGMPLWGSIGYSIPALLGAAMADRDSRGVLLVGDGSAQLTIQELGTIIRENLNPVIFVVNNEGYTIERSIHGPEAQYNDITAYNWQKIPEGFGATEENSIILKATTSEELVHACTVAREVRDRLVFVEVATDKNDMPQLLRDFGALVEEMHKKA
ncbi:alpha-keto acid decarboxylase family protein [Rothia sp. P6271]|uniref:alpha-keto acid decarboxylase family protein n=1 Tax=Rothia sp. P6271 TaxID=3402659 RepID=UPI003ACE33EF